MPGVAQKFAKYWICQVRLMEHQGNLEVLPMFEEAVRVVLEVNHFSAGLFPRLRTLHVLTTCIIIIWQCDAQPGPVLQTESKSHFLMHLCKPFTEKGLNLFTSQC